MPDSTAPVSTGAGITPWIGAAGGLISDITSLFGQSAANRQSQRYNTQMINQQRQWALQDQAAQNLYNSPVQQMARLKEAKLNPNMIYGTGVQGSTGQQGSQPRATAAPSYNPQSVTSGFRNLGAELLDSIQKVANIEQTKEATKNLGASRDNINADTINKGKHAILQDIENQVAKSNGRSDPAMKDFYRFMDQNNAGYEEKIKGNTARASEVIPAQASLDLNVIRDKNTREWAANARAEALQKPTLALAIQSVQNSLEQNVGMKQANQNAAAEFQNIMSSIHLKDVEAAQKSMQNLDVSQYAEDIIDALILSKALKGGASPIPGGGNKSTIRPFQKPVTNHGRIMEQHGYSADYLERKNMTP